MVGWDECEQNQGGAHLNTHAPNASHLANDFESVSKSSLSLEDKAKVVEPLFASGGMEMLIRSAVEVRRLNSRWTTTIA